jgi:hypothetical protein
MRLLARARASDQPVRVTDLTELLPVAVDLSRRGEAGPVELSNRGTITEWEISDLYRQLVDPCYCPEYALTGAYESRPLPELGPDDTSQCWRRVYPPARTAREAVRAALRAIHHGVASDVKEPAGSDGYFFLARDGSRMLEYLCGKLRAPDAVFDAQAEALRQRREEFGGLGIDYLFVPVPDKPEVLPEYLPGGWEPAADTTLDRFFARAPADVVLDLRPALTRAKADWGGPPEPHLYYKIDSHWTPRGAHAAYGELVRWVGRRHPTVGEPLGLNRFPFVTIGPKRADLFHLFPPEFPQAAYRNDLSHLPGRRGGRYTPLVPQVLYDFRDKIGFQIGREWLEFLEDYFREAEFDWTEYTAANPDLGWMGEHEARRHWLHHGRHEGRPGLGRPVPGLVEYVLSRGGKPRSERYYQLHPRDELAQAFVSWQEGFLPTDHCRRLFRTTFGGRGDEFWDGYRGEAYQHHCDARDLGEIGYQESVAPPEYVRHPNQLNFITERPRPDLPTAVMFVDLYMLAHLCFMLSVHFRRAVYVWNCHAVAMAVVRREMPDVVLNVFAGRYLVEPFEAFQD